MCVCVGFEVIHLAFQMHKSILAQVIVDGSCTAAVSQPHNLTTPLELTGFSDVHVDISICLYSTVMLCCSIPSMQFWMPLP